MKLWEKNPKKSCLIFFLPKWGIFVIFWGIKGNERFSREFEPVTRETQVGGWQVCTSSSLDSICTTTVHAVLLSHSSYCQFT